jgi:hypothetical protein
VLERAALYGRPVIVTAVGGLQGQSAGRAVVVADDDALFSAMWEAAGRRPATGWDLPPDAPRSDVMAAIRARAAAQRGTATATAEFGRAGRVPALGRPQPASPSAAGRLVKSAVGRLTNWQMEPVYRQLDVLRAAIVERERKM